MGVTTQTEVERKYDVEDGAVAPVFDGVAGVETVETSEPVELVTTYFDTAEGALAREGIALRRRTGGPDEGWHIKRRGDGRGRQESRWPLGDDVRAGVPDEVLDGVRVHTRTADVAPIARIAVQRTTTELMADGHPVAEFSDDRVTATDLAGGTVRVWREWEVELAGDGDAEGGDDLLEAVEKRLLAAGASPSASEAKIARALGREADESPRADDPVSGAPAPVRALAALRDALVAIDPRVRDDEPDALHAMRSITRRLRSVLGAYKDAFPADARTDVRDRLRTLGSVLGGARDLEVRVERARNALAVLPDGLEVDDAARARLVDGPGGERSDSHRRVLLMLRGSAYLSFLERLDALIEEAARTARGGKGDRKTVKRSVSREVERVLSRVDSGSHGDGEGLHDVRKAAKRLRFAVEPLRDVDPDVVSTRQAKVAKAAERIQDTLGESRDAAAFADHLLLTARRARAAGEDTFVYGVLYALARQASDAALAEYGPLVSRLRELAADL